MWVEGGGGVMVWLASYIGKEGYIENKGMFEDKDDALDCLD